MKVSQGALFGATQALTCTLTLKFVKDAVMAAIPCALVVALEADSEAVPRVSWKLTVTFGMGAPRLRASTVRGTESDAP